ncbi:MAG: hypothetical protein HRU32_16100 [Rhodobacteraceae bacterium]|nr:hypothetical protein [Paracoccaceae bacterium]
MLRHWMDRFDAGITLHRRMSEIVQLDHIEPLTAKLQEQVRTAMITCTVCDLKARCDAWLLQAEAGNDPPDFCNNRALFLKTRDASET